jgi:Reverse transcriptase (RNA-dependent DNA polymerase)
VILGKTWLNTHGVLLDMLHDKLIFHPNRCDHGLPTSLTKFPEPKESKQPSPRITQILKRANPPEDGPGGVPDRERGSDSNKGSVRPTPTRHARKPRRKNRKQTTEESLNEPKPASIVMIGAAAYRSLIRKKDVQIFSITPCQIDQMLESLSR